jgi:hypothetical protein
MKRIEGFETGRRGNDAAVSPAPPLNKVIPEGLPPESRSMGRSWVWANGSLGNAAVAVSAAEQPRHERRRVRLTTIRE